MLAKMKNNINTNFSCQGDSLNQKPNLTEESLCSHNLLILCFKKIFLQN